MTFFRTIGTFFAVVSSTLCLHIPTAQAVPVDYLSWLESGVTVRGAYTGANVAGMGADYYRFHIDSTLYPGDQGFMFPGFKFRVVGLNEFGVGREGAITAPLYVTSGLFVDSNDIPYYASVFKGPWTGGSTPLRIFFSRLEVGDYTFAVSWTNPFATDSVKLGYELTMLDVGVPPKAESTIPEPSTLALALFGIALLVLGKRKRKSLGS